MSSARDCDVVPHERRQARGDGAGDRGVSDVAPVCNQLVSALAYAVSEIVPWDEQRTEQLQPEHRQDDEGRDTFFRETGVSSTTSTPSGLSPPGME